MRPLADTHLPRLVKLFLVALACVRAPTFASAMVLDAECLERVLFSLAAGGALGFLCAFLLLPEPDRHSFNAHLTTSMTVDCRGSTCSDERVQRWQALLAQFKSLLLLSDEEMAAAAVSRLRLSSSSSRTPELPASLLALLLVSRSSPAIAGPEFFFEERGSQQQQQQQGSGALLVERFVRWYVEGGAAAERPSSGALEFHSAAAERERLRVLRAALDGYTTRVQRSNALSFHPITPLLSRILRSSDAT